MRSLFCYRLKLDEPIGVGFSYAENGQVVGRAEQAALDVQAFIAIFIESFSEFKGRPLHLVSLPKLLQCCRSRLKQCNRTPSPGRRVIRRSLPARLCCRYLRRQQGAR